MPSTSDDDDDDDAYIDAFIDFGDDNDNETNKNDNASGEVCAPDFHNDPHFVNSRKLSDSEGVSGILGGLSWLFGTQLKVHEQPSLGEGRMWLPVNLLDIMGIVLRFLSKPVQKKLKHRGPAAKPMIDFSGEDIRLTGLTDA